MPQTILCLSRFLSVHGLTATPDRPFQCLETCETVTPQVSDAGAHKEMSVVERQNLLTTLNSGMDCYNTCALRSQAGLHSFEVRGSPSHNTHPQDTIDGGSAIIRGVLVTNGVNRVQTNSAHIRGAFPIRFRFSTMCLTTSLRTPATRGTQRQWARAESHVVYVPS